MIDQTLPDNMPVPTAASVIDPAKFRPLDDQVFIKVDEPERQKGKIIIPRPEAPWTGTVVAVGPGHKVGKTRLGDMRGENGPQGYVVPMTVKPGERVMFVKGLLRDIGADGYGVVSEGQLLGVLG